MLRRDGFGGQSVPERAKVFVSVFVRTAFSGAVAMLAACTPAPTPSGIDDPYEASNRRTHAFNKSLDRSVLRPVSNGYVKVVPEPVVTGIGNVANNLATPSMVVNNVLQGDVEGAVVNTFRFALNSTVGLAGLFDVATWLELEQHDTDFGETLYTWGVPEGAYVELPVMGPSTQRETAGRVVDLFTNPLGYTLENPEKYAAPAAGVAKKLGDRGRYSQTVDSVLYDSADSYAQGRVTYLQNRRYKLSGGAGDALDPYGDATTGTGDPYDDPYDQ